MVLDAVRARPELAREEQACHMLCRRTSIIMNESTDIKMLVPSFLMQCFFPGFALEQ